MSVRLRLAALFTLATVVLVGVGGYVYIHQLRTRLETSLDQSLESRESTIAAALPADPLPPLPGGVRGSTQVFTSDGDLVDSSRDLIGDRLLTVEQVQNTAAARDHPARLNGVVDIHSADDAGPEAMRIYGARTGSAHIVVAVAARRDLVDEAVEQSRRQLLTLGIIIVALAGPASWLLARAALRPVDRMRAQVARLEAANTAQGVPVPRARDEIARLGRTFNTLLARVHAAFQRERAFVADAGHELRTPLTVLKGELELAQRPGRSRSDLLATVNVAAAETDRLIRLTENLLFLAHPGGPVPQRPVDLADTVQDAISAAGPSAAASGVTLALQDEGVGVVDGDADRLRQAVDNLLTNAIQHSPSGATVTIRLARDKLDAIIEVSDEGPGFPPTFLPYAFERFARADVARARSREGYGLGLAIVATIMTGHGGIATAANRPDGGAVLTLRWPQPAPRVGRFAIPAKVDG